LISCNDVEFDSSLTIWGDIGTISDAEITASSLSSGTNEYGLGLISLLLATTTTNYNYSNYNLLEILIIINVDE